MTPIRAPLSASSSSQFQYNRQSDLITLIFWQGLFISTRNPALDYKSTSAPSKSQSPHAPTSPQSDYNDPHRRPLARAIPRELRKEPRLDIQSNNNRTCPVQQTRPALAHCRIPRLLAEARVDAAQGRDRGAQDAEDRAEPGCIRE